MQVWRTLHGFGPYTFHLLTLQAIQPIALHM